jgi:hypothetical protein
MGNQGADGWAAEVGQGGVADGWRDVAKERPSVLSCGLAGGLDDSPHRAAAGVGRMRARLKAQFVRSTVSRIVYVNSTYCLGSVFDMIKSCPILLPDPA